MNRKDEKPSISGFVFCICILVAWFVMELVLVAILEQKAEEILNNQPTPTPIVITNSPTPIPTITPTNTPAPSNTPIPSPTVTPTPFIPLSESVVTDALKVVQGWKDALYDAYSAEELELLFRVVEAEATGHGVMCKSHVASVIFNRIQAGWHEGDLTKNLLATRQFAVITDGRYQTVTITQSTISACIIAFHNDTAQGALYFDSTKGKSWAHQNKEFLFADDVHWFYK